MNPGKHGKMSVELNGWPAVLMAVPVALASALSGVARMCGLPSQVTAVQLSAVTKAP
eukprot:COSAG01_NODE_41450_length_451_cov_1.161932_1_plen_56_part_01